jgi:hypothetical protein
MTTPVEAVTSTRVVSRRKRVTRNPKRRRGLDTPDTDERDDAALGPGSEPKSDQ